MNAFAFISIFGIFMPYLAIIFSYIMILRKYNGSKSKMMEHSTSVRSRTSLGDRRMSKVMESSYMEQSK